MAAPTEDKPKQVPKRVDVRPTGLFRNTQALHLDGRDPNFEYQYFTQDAKSPAYIGKRLKPHMYGNGPNKIWIEPWEQCHSQTDAQVRSMDPRTDQGAKVDTLERFGDQQILCRIPKSEFAKYAQADDANDKEKERQLMEPDRHRAQHASMTAVVAKGDLDEESRLQALANAGHNFPNAPRAHQ